MRYFQSGVLLPEHTAILVLDDDGVFPNNPHLPVVIYEHAFQISNDDQATEEIEQLLKDNGWHNPWRGGIYDYHHYHSTAHEVLICVTGNARLRLGGPSGASVDFKTGDVIILPAGTAHVAEGHSLDFSCIGAYPDGQEFDMNYGKTEERSKAADNIFKVPLPKADPVYGSDGPLIFHWQIV